jgi:hypothetical protein
VHASLQVSLNCPRRTYAGRTGLVISRDFAPLIAHPQEVLAAATLCGEVIWRYFHREWCDNAKFCILGQHGRHVDD